MGTVNINRNVTDMFYRYKMPKIIVKVEGKGNGIKTRIVNMSEIAKALVRPPSYPTKFFGCELGAQTTIDNKTDKYIVNGSFTSDKLQDMLDVFIQKFVLCPKCENPETSLTVDKKQTIHQRCMACGYRGPLTVVHKLTQFVIKNPPNSLADNGAGKKDKKGKGKKKKDSDSEEDKEKVNGQQVHAQYQDADREVDQESPPPVAESDEVDDEWGAVEDEAEQMGEALSSISVSGDAEKSTEEKMNIFFNFVENKKKGGSVAAQSKDLYAEAERLDIIDKAPIVLAEVLLTENVIKELSAYRIVFLRFTNQNKRAQRSLLLAIEMFIKTNIILLPKTGHILKCLYDNDIVDEEVLISWHAKASKKTVGKELSAQIHAKAEPFIKWLQEAEEESDSEEESEEEEDDEVALEFSYQAGSGGLTEAKAKPAAAEEEDDFDIDAI